MAILRTLTCALCLGPLPGAAMAQSDGSVDRSALSELDRMGMEVGTFAAEYLAGYGDLFEPQLLVRMAFVAQQRAIAHTCEGFDVDITRYNDAMREIMQPIVEMIEVPEDATGVVINLPLTIAMSAYSMVLGGNIAAGAADPDAMCALGSEIRASDAGDEALRIWTTAD